MLIKMKDLNRMRPMLEGNNSSIYVLNDGIIAKRFKHLTDNEKREKTKKILLSDTYKEIEGLSLPIDILETEKGICGYLQEKREGIPFGDYCNSVDEGVSLDEIVNYFCKLENIVKKANELEMFFPDLSTYGNVLYDQSAKEVSVLDYDGSQIKGLPSGNISSFIYHFFDYFCKCDKYSSKSNDISTLLYNDNIDKFTLAYRFFYYATKLKFPSFDYFKENLEFYLRIADISNTSFADCMRKLLNEDIPNSYISDSILELSSEYVLTKKESGKPRVFVKK